MHSLREILYFACSTILILLGLVLILINIESVGGSLIAGGIAGIVMYWALYISREINAEEQKLLADSKEHGIVRVYDRRLMPDRYKEVREKATGSFDMLGFGLRTFLEDNKDSLEEWAERFVIRILVIHPESPYCEQRDYEENDPKGKIKEDVLHITNIVKGLNNPKIKIRWYNALPVTNIFRMGDTMFVGPYFVNTRSRNSMTIELNAGGLLFDRYLEHFNQIWEDPKLSCEPEA